MTIRRALSLVAFCVAGALPAAAGMIGFSNRDAFLAALPNSSEETFSSISAGNLGASTIALTTGTILYDVTTDNTLWGVTIGGNRSLSTSAYTAYLLVSNFSAPVYAIGGYFFFDDNNSGISNDSAGTVGVDNSIDPLLLGNIPAPGSTTFFFGVVSDSPIVSLRFVNNGATGYVNMDNLILSGDGTTVAAAAAAEVPEPSTYAMIGVAGIASWAMGRRKLATKIG